MSNEEDDPANARIIEALRTLDDEHTPPPGWEERILAQLPQPSRWQRLKAWLLRGFRAAD